MDETSFIAEQLSDLAHNAEFEPFEIYLISGSNLEVTHPDAVTLLSGGVFYHAQDGAHVIMPYESILMLHTIFDV